MIHTLIDIVDAFDIRIDPETLDLWDELVNLDRQVMKHISCRRVDCHYLTDKGERVMCPLPIFCMRIFQ